MFEGRYNMLQVSPNLSYTKTNQKQKSPDTQCVGQIYHRLGVKGGPREVKMCFFWFSTSWTLAAAWIQFFGRLEALKVYLVSKGGFSRNRLKQKFCFEDFQENDLPELVCSIYLILYVVHHDWIALENVVYWWVSEMNTCFSLSSIF